MRAEGIKILLYSETFFPSTGGIQTVALELSCGLAQSIGAERFEVTAVTKTAGAPQQDSRLPFRIIRRPSVWKLVRLLYDTDIIHLAGPALMPLFLGLLLKKPVVVEHHGFQTVCPNGQLLYEPARNSCPGHYMANRYWECVRCNAGTRDFYRSIRLLLLTPLRRWLCNRATWNIMPTDWLGSVLRLNRAATVLHGISPRPELKSQAPPSHLVFAYQGRLVSSKGVQLLLQAFAQLCQERRDLRLKIVGVGPEEQSLRTEAANLNGKVEFWAHVPNENLDQVLSDAAVVVMPSLAGEVFGLVAAENMLRGKLVIVSDLGSLREVVGDAGLIFRAGDTCALAAAMRKAIDDPSQVSTLARRARVRALRVFDKENMIRAHALLYREALLVKGRAN